MSTVAAAAAAPAVATDAAADRPGSTQPAAGALRDRVLGARRRCGSPRYVQDALAVDFDCLTDEQLFGERPTRRDDLPDPRPWAGHIAQGLVEVMAGARPAPQVLRWTTPEVYAAVARRAAVSARRGAAPDAAHRRARGAGLRAGRRRGRGERGRGRRRTGARAGVPAGRPRRPLAGRGPPGRLTPHPTTPRRLLATGRHQTPDGGRMPTQWPEVRGRVRLRSGCGQALPWHILNFLPEPQGHGPLRETPLSCSSVSVSLAEPTPRCSTSPVSLGAEYCSCCGRRSGCSRPLARKVGCFSADAPRLGGLPASPSAAPQHGLQARPTSAPARRRSCRRRHPRRRWTAPNPASMSETLTGCTAPARGVPRAGRRRPGR